MPRRLESISIAAVVVIVTFLGWQTTRSSEVAPPPPIVEQGTEPAEVTVHVSGAVRRPGVFRLSAGARVVEAVEAAGGVTPTAAVGAVNLAAEVTDGQQIVVPDLVDGVASRVDTGVADGVVVVNQATAAELESLPGVGPVLAGRIISHRDEHGPFESPEDLLDVAGIGEATLARLRPLVRIP